jgi:Zn-dependent protease
MLAVSFAGIDFTVVAIGMACWFIQMGIHEGAHAYTANHYGDDTPRLTGQLSFNPVRHLNPKEPMRLVWGVLVPLITMVSIGFPSGMAWVYVNRHSLTPAQDAVVSAAGPIGNFILSAVVLALAVAAYPYLKVEGELAAYGWFSLKMLFFVSMVYGIISIMPIPGLDGGWVAYYFANARLRQIIEQMAPYGIMILFLLSALGLTRFLMPLYTASLRTFEEFPARVWGLS